MPEPEAWGTSRAKLPVIVRMAQDPRRNGGGDMQSVLVHVQGVVAAATAFWVTKLVAWTDFEFGVFVAVYLAAAIPLDRGMKRYGTRGG
jgi:hypothetical protein